MRSDRVQLVAASFLMLFVELVLIRWAGSYVVYLSYFSNFVLLGSFLGIGVGFLRGHRGPDLFRWAPLMLAIFFVAVMVFPVTLDRSGGDLVYFGSLQTRGLPIWVMLPFVFLSVAAVMTTIAHGVAKRFSLFPALEAYRLDILGSLSGIVTYAAMSLLQIPPIGWGIVIVGLFAYLLWPVAVWQPAVGVAILAVLIGATFAPNTTWSPYYRILFHPDDLAIDVNGIPHQTMQDVANSPLYNEPYKLVDRPPGNVLVIGAGNGNDVAAALAAGATHVDAVEIDPAIQELGVEHHPDHPYDDPRVTRIVGDGRSFLERTHNTYDMIMLALPDSLTLVSGQGSVRLESFLFTQQAMQAAKDRLNPDGAFAMYNYYREPWLLDRFAGTLQDVYGQAPCLYTGPTARDQVIGGLSMLVAGTDPSTVVCHGDGTQVWQPSGEVVATPQGLAVAADSGVALPLDARLDPARLGDRRATCGRQVRCDARLSRPVLHGRGFPAARDEIRRAVRVAVRYDVVRERARVRRRVAYCALRHRGRATNRGAQADTSLPAAVRRLADRRARAGVLAPLS